jgi:hypothetical protein
MGIKKYLRERKEARRLYNKGYNTDTMQMIEGVQHMVERKRERLQRKAEYHSQKGQEFGNYMRAFNQGDGSSLLGAAGSLGHKMKASYYQHKLNDGGLDRYAIRKQKQIAGKVKFKDEEENQEHYSISSNFKNGVKGIRKGLKFLKRSTMGDSGNKRLPYRRKKAMLELRSFDSEKKKVNEQMEKALRNPDHYKGKRLEKLKRRHLAANTKMSIKDERKFYRTRDNKATKRFMGGMLGFNVASYGAVPVAAAIAGPTGAAVTQAASSIAYNGTIGAAMLYKNRKHILDQRYEYMKKNGYVK